MKFTGSICPYIKNTGDVISNDKWMDGMLGPGDVIANVEPETLMFADGSRMSIPFGSRLVPGPPSGDGVQ